MSRVRSLLLAGVCVAALAACSSNNSTSSVTTGKSSASASLSPQPVAAPSTSAAAPANGETGYPSQTLHFHSGQASVHIDGGTADGKTLAATSFTAALDQESTDTFNPKTGEFELRWVDENGHGLEVDGTAPRHGTIDAFVRIEVNPAAFTDSFHTQCETKLTPSATSVSGQFTCDELPNFAGKGTLSGATGNFTATG